MLVSLTISYLLLMPFRLILEQPWSSFVLSEASSCTIRTWKRTIWSWASQHDRPHSWVLLYVTNDADQIINDELRQCISFFRATDLDQCDPLVNGSFHERLSFSRCHHVMQFDSSQISTNKKVMQGKKITIYFYPTQELPRMKYLA